MSCLSLILGSMAHLLITCAWHTDCRQAYINVSDQIVANIMAESPLKKENAKVACF